MKLTPELTTKDWNSEWKELQKARRAADDASHWDERAKTYHKASLPPSPYVTEFIEYAGIEDGDSVFDMGAGTGAVSIPLAANGHEVLACDFSEGMLSVLRKEAEKNGIVVQTKLLSWADDWEKKGIAPKSFDVATASRSIATADLRDSLSKLSGVAKRRCAITLPVGPSPRTDDAILKAIGMSSEVGHDFAYAFMILMEMGYLPEVRYILSARHDTYDTEEEAYSSLERMVRDSARGTASEDELSEALSKLREWLAGNLISNPNAGKKDAYGETEGALRLKETRKATWAHIAWNVQ